MTVISKLNGVKKRSEISIDSANGRILKCAPVGCCAFQAMRAVLITCAILIAPLCASSAFAQSLAADQSFYLPGDTFKLTIDAGSTYAGNSVKFRWWWNGASFTPPGATGCISASGATWCDPGGPNAPVIDAGGTWTTTGSYGQSTNGDWREQAIINGVTMTNTIDFTIGPPILVADRSTYLPTDSFQITITANSLHTGEPVRYKWWKDGVSYIPPWAGNCVNGWCFPGGPNPPYIASNGILIETGVYNASLIGTWREQAIINDVIVSNEITFVIAPSSSCSANQGQSCNTNTNCGGTYACDGTTCQGGTNCQQQGGSCDSGSCVAGCSSNQGQSCSTPANCGGVYACDGVTCTGGVNCTQAGYKCAWGTCALDCKPAMGQSCNTNTNCGGAYACDGVTCVGGTNCTAQGGTCNGGACTIQPTPSPTPIPPTPSPTPGPAGVPIPAGIPNILFGRATIPNLMSVGSVGAFAGIAIDFLLLVGIISMVALIVYAGIRMMLALGNPSQYETAKRILTWAVVGFVIMMLAKAFIYVVRNFV